MFDGLVAATVTPMRADYSIDEDALRRYVKHIAEQGVAGIAVNVDTGEGPHLYPHERLRICEIVAEEVGDRVTVVAGLAAAFTDQAVQLARDTAAAGAQALLVFPIPAYLGVPLNPEIPVRYHRAIAESCGLPLIAFQLQPALGGVTFSMDVLRQLLAVDGVVAIKEASFDAKQFVETGKVAHEAGVSLLNGNDNFLREAYVLGADGALLGFGTLVTAEQVQLFESTRSGVDAHDLGERLQTLCDAIFAAPVSDYRARTKHALKLLDLIPDDRVRPPLPMLGDAEKARVRSALQQAGLL
jgi:4-hydroxy-tetrahydrodipicolinate synthase